MADFLLGVIGTPSGTTLLCAVGSVHHVLLTWSPYMLLTHTPLLETRKTGFEMVARRSARTVVDRVACSSKGAPLEDSVNGEWGLTLLDKNVFHDNHLRKISY